MVFGKRGTFTDSQANRRDRFRQDLSLTVSALERLGQQLEIVRQSLSVAPITSHDWIYSLLLGQAIAHFSMLKTSIVCLINALEEKEGN